MYDQLGLDKEYRTPRLKKYHALEAISRAMWRDNYFVFVLGQLMQVPTSMFTLLDGYPKMYSDVWRAHIEYVYDKLFSKKIPPGLKGRISTKISKNAIFYMNDLSAQAAHAEELDICFVNFADSENLDAYVPESDVYNKALVNMNAANQAQYKPGTPGMTMDAENRLTEEDIKKMSGDVIPIGKKKDEGDNGNGLH